MHNDVHCTDCTHIDELNMLYSSIITCIIAASEESVVHIRQVFHVTLLLRGESGSLPYGRLLVKKN